MPTGLYSRRHACPPARPGSAVRRHRRVRKRGAPADRARAEHARPDRARAEHARSPHRARPLRPSSTPTSTSGAARCISCALGPTDVDEPTILLEAGFGDNSDRLGRDHARDGACASAVRVRPGRGRPERAGCRTVADGRGPRRRSPGAARCGRARRALRHRLPLVRCGRCDPVHGNLPRRRRRAAVRRPAESPDLGAVPGRAPGRDRGRAGRPGAGPLQPGGIRDRPVAEPREPQPPPELRGRPMRRSTPRGRRSAIGRSWC